ncbi:unnamed protein product [Urochloa humidicola]
MMKKFTAKEVQDILDKNGSIGNMSVIDHERVAGMIIAEEVARNVRITDTRVDEAERGITMQSTGISLYYEMNDKSLKSCKGERDGKMIDLVFSWVKM